MLESRSPKAILRRIGVYGNALMAACLCGLLAAGCNRNSAPAFAPPPATVLTAEVKAVDVPVYLDEIGKTVATEVINVLPQVSGQIVQINFKDGQDLKKGDPLFLIDPRPYKAQLDAAQATLEQNQAQLDYARKNFARIVSLMPSKAVAQTDYDTAKEAVDVGVANVKSSQAAIETAKLNLDYCTITSPTDGRAGHRLVDVGNVVVGLAGNMITTTQTALLVIQKISPIYVDFTVTEADLPNVRASIAAALQNPDINQRFLPVEIQSPDQTAKPIMGKLTFLDNTVQDGTGTITLRATVDNADRVLWPGQFVRERLILRTDKGALMVPNEAIQIGQKGTFVFVVSKLAMPKDLGTIEQRPVTVGQRQGNMTVIETGLNAGENVVTAGQLMLQPGDKVMAKPEAVAASTQPTTMESTTRPSTEASHP